MAAWLTVYCTRSVSHVTARDLLTAIEDIEDIYTLAEGFGIEDEEVVKRALTQLRIEPVSEPEGVKFCLRYRPAAFRPVLIHWSAAPEFVRGVVEETRELLEEATGKGVKRVRAHLERVIEVVSLELGWSQLEDMGIVLAGQVAEHLATIGAGLIKDQNDDWWAMKKGAPVLLVGPERRA